MKRGDILSKDHDAICTESILAEAYALVYGERGEIYGHPRENFQRTADLWRAVLGIEVTPAQVALCMVLVKVARLVETPDHRDGWVDLAGYAETGARCEGLDP